MPVEGLSLHFVLHARVLGIEPRFSRSREPQQPDPLHSFGYESGAAEQGAHANA